ncbi:MAG: FAD-dependent oxidoreductase [Oscillospiraceae bacterium]|nr:FAD-dependent oxidoreductase [Oscillospiraceae bacterium]
MKVVIVGGVAAGASCAARLRRLDEQAEIVMIERSGFVSYANCGLPYYVGGEIQNKSALTLQTPKSFLTRFCIDARVNQEVVSINRKQKCVTVKKLQTQEIYDETYDKLVLCPGAKPVVPQFSCGVHPQVFTLRTVEDAFKMEEFITKNQPQNAVIVGAGFIGLEMAENLMRRKMHVTVVEKALQVMAPLDEDMAQIVHTKLKEKGVVLKLGTAVKDIFAQAEELKIALDNQDTIKADMVVLAIGIAPDSTLAQQAGLALGVRGTIAVNPHMQTSDEDIFAAGDAVQVHNSVSDALTQIPLAGPANRQGRLIADVIAGKKDSYEGAQGSSILKLFEMTIATTGLNEKTAKQANKIYECIILPTAASHATYYPGAENMVLKVLFETSSGKVLGAQVIGGQGADKRMDILATAVQAGLTSKQLAGLDLCYAPPFGSAKDPVNIAGNVMENIRKGLVKQWYTLQQPANDKDAVLLDVRTPEEYAQGAFAGSINIPLDTLRDNLDKLDKNKHYYVNCVSALRSYLACRILSQNGLTCYNFAGGYRYYQLTNPNGPENKTEDKGTLTACGMGGACTAEK